MDDRTLLERAAKAAGLKIYAKAQAERDAIMDPKKASLWLANGTTAWNPLTNDGDALRLAVKLNMTVRCYMGTTVAQIGTPGLKNADEEVTDHADPYAATRCAIVRAAAEIGGE